MQPWWAEETWVVLICCCLWVFSPSHRVCNGYVSSGLQPGSRVILTSILMLASCRDFICFRFLCNDDCIYLWVFNYGRSHAWFSFLCKLGRSETCLFKHVFPRIWCVSVTTDLYRKVIDLHRVAIWPLNLSCCWLMLFNMILIILLKYGTIFDDWIVLEQFIVHNMTF